jgi:hypothetical protein
MDKQQRGTGPYRSALDLPSVAEMLELVRGAKLLTRVIARDQRSKLQPKMKPPKHLRGRNVATNAGGGERSWTRTRMTPWG